MTENTDYDDGYSNGSNDAVTELKGVAVNVIQNRIDELNDQKREIEAILRNLIGIKESISSKLE